VSLRRSGRQHIPRPAGARPGQPAPWSALPDEARKGLHLAHVRAALAEVGPPQRPELVMPGARAAAVLVALFEEEGETRVLLTRRTTTLPSHRGEVAFPGGTVDDGEDACAAALREAHEEVGLSAAAVEIVAELDHLATVASRFVLAPFVGVLAQRPALSPNPREVDRVFDVSIAELLEDGTFREERWGIRGGDWPVFFFELAGDTVWGATARILHQLLSVVTGLSPPKEPRPATGRR
jgi:8-oxo-dGTP pyrophosphatase MutT (NUDIX family)